jgi:dipeptidyl aminopeptidase/acylaminoacyl peptidase
VAVIRSFTPADALRVRHPLEAGWISRSHCFYVVSEVRDGDRDEQSLWLYERESGSRTRVAASVDLVGSVRVSPAGDRLAFLARRDGRNIIHLLSVDTGEVTELDCWRQSVGSLGGWSPTGTSLCFTARSDAPRDPTLPYRVDRRTYRLEGVGIVEDAVEDVLIVDVGSIATRQLTSNRCVNTRLRWSPDGRHILFIRSLRPDVDWEFQPELAYVDVESGASRVVVGNDWGGIAWAEWAGDQIVFVGAPAAGGGWLAQKRDLWTVKRDGTGLSCRTTNLLQGVGLGLQVDTPTWHVLSSPRMVVSSDGTEALLSVQAGGSIGVYRVALQGPERRECLLDGERVCLLLDADATSGALLYLTSALLDPPELCIAEGGEEVTFTDLNETLMDGIELPQAQAFTVDSPGGFQLDAWALHNGAVPADRGTVLCIHGGPYGSYGNIFSNDFHVLAGAGFNVVFSNFRGSAGYGTEFSQAITGRWGEIGAEDHLATVDRAVELGISDASRLGVYGISHGGFATCWLVGHSQRFRAAASEAASTNFATAYGASDAPRFIALELGGTPSEIADVYAERSPLTYATACRTPLLLVVGEDDLRLRPAEAEQFYRVLKDTGCETEMLRLPGSDHLGTWTGRPVIRSAQDEALRDWFLRHLGDDATPGS